MVKNKRLGLLLVLIMLFSMFIMTGAASAEVDYIDVGSGYTYVKAGEDDQSIGDIYLTYNEGFIEGAEDYRVTITLITDGVSFDNGENELDFDTKNPILNDLKIDVDDDVTGNIVCEIQAFAINPNMDSEIEKQTIAKVDTDDLIVRDINKLKSVQIGSKETAANITIKESGISGFNGQDIKFTILTDGVRFNDDSSFNKTIDFYEIKDKTYIFNYDGTTGQDTIIFTPVLKVLPSIDDGDIIEIKVSGDNIESTILEIAKVTSQEDYSIKIIDQYEDILYRGQEGILDDVIIKIEPDVDWSNFEYFTITLPDEVYFDGNDPININTIFELEDIYNDDQTAWFTIDSNLDDVVKLSNFKLKIKDAVIGDLKIEFNGDIEGSYIIGKINSSININTTPIIISNLQNVVNGSDIEIVENEDGALQEGILEFILPNGVEFDSKPEIKVTNGNIDIDDIKLINNNRVLSIEIENDSSDASTILISNIKYNIIRNFYNDIYMNVGYEDEDSFLKFNIGTTRDKPITQYTVGSSTYIVNNQEYTSVNPSYIENDRTYLAIQDIAVGLGINPVNVLWNDSNNTITLIKDTKIVQLQIGSKIMNVNGISVNMDVAPEIRNARAMLPIGYVAQAFGSEVIWNGINQTITVK